MRKVIKTTTLILAIIVAIFLVIEVVFGQLNSQRSGSEPTFAFQHTNLGYSDGTDRGNVLGLSAIGNSSTLQQDQYKLSKNEELIQEYTVSRDDAGWRVSYDSQAEDYSRHAIFLGGSFTEGAGLADWETIPSAFAQLTEGYAPYNFGKGGTGTATALDYVQNQDVLARVQESDGFMIYTYIRDHLGRNAGDMHRSSSEHNYPFYYIEKGQLIHGGTLEEDRQPLTSIYRALNNLQVVEYYDINLPILSNYHVDLTVEMAKEIERIYSRSHSGQFVFAFHPCDLSPRNDLLDKYLTDRLAQESIPYLAMNVDEIYADYSIDELNLKDWHPSALCHKLYVEELIRFLGINAETSI